MSISSVQPDHRVALWKTLLTAELNACYWGWISDRYTKWDNGVRFLIAATASGAVAGWNIWAQYPGAWKTLSAVACIASIAHPFFLSTEKLKRMSSLVATWKELSANYDLLWEKDGNLVSPESWNQFESMKRREGSIDETTLPKNPKLLNEAFEHVLRMRGLSNA